MSQTPKSREEENLSVLFRDGADDLLEEERFVGAIESRVRWRCGLSVAIADRIPRHPIECEIRGDPQQQRFGISDAVYRIKGDLQIGVLNEVICGC